MRGYYKYLGARSEFFWREMTSRVNWGWHDNYGEMNNFGRVGDKSMFKIYKKSRVVREGDI